METKNRILTISLIILTFSLLAMEVSYTRVYSFLFNHSYVYFLISMGISGLGIGSLVLYKYHEYLSKKFIYIVYLPILITLLILWINISAPNIFISLSLMLILFSVIGIGISIIYKKSNLIKTKLYFYDLLGSALGSISAYFAMQHFGVFGVIKNIPFLISFALLLIYMETQKNKIKNLIYFSIIFISLIIANNYDIEKYIALPKNSNKEMQHSLKNLKGKIIDSKWNAFGRVDVVEFPNNRDKKVFFIDGSAGTVMINQDEDKNENRRKILQNSTTLALTSIAVDAKNKDTLVIGSGAGGDVSTLLEFGAKSITAVELNPLFIEFAKKYGSYNQDIYNNHEKVNIINQEGRNYVRNIDKKFDLLVISLPLIKSIRNYENYAMSEGYLFTRNAIDEYRNILRDNGYFVVITHGDWETFRIMANILESFKKDGINEKTAMKSIATINFGQNNSVVIMRKGTISGIEQVRIHEAMHILPQTKTGINFVPGISQEVYGDDTSSIDSKKIKMFNEIFYSISEGTSSIEEIKNKLLLDISAITDDKPYFYNARKNVPIQIMTVFVFSLVLIINMYMFDSKKNKRDILYFILIGISFMMIEITILQKISFFWGQTTLALSLILSIILIASGIGSFASKLIKNDQKKLKIVSFLTPIFSLIFLVLGERILKNFESTELVIKLLTTLVIIFPQFFILGFVFPTLLKNIKTSLVPKMIAYNSIATLLGASISMIIAMKFGFTALLLTGTLLYTTLIFYKFDI